MNVEIEERHKQCRDMSPSSPQSLHAQREEGVVVADGDDDADRPDAIRSLEMEVVALKRQRDAMRTRISEYHKVLGKSRRNAKDSAAERAGLRVAAEAAQGECGRLRIRMKRLIAENYRLRTDNEEMEDMVTLLRDNAESLTKERDEWKAKWEEAVAARDSSGAPADDASSACSSRLSLSTSRSISMGSERGATTRVTRRLSSLGGDGGRAQASSLASGLYRAAATYWF